MSAVRLVTIRCDADGCPRHEASGWTVQEARAAVRAIGWRYVPGNPASSQPVGRDLCPEHAPGVAR